MHELGELGGAHLALVRFLSGVESQVGLEIAGAAEPLVANLQCGERGRAEDEELPEGGASLQMMPSSPGGEKPPCGTNGVALSKQGDVATLHTRWCLFPLPFSTHWELAVSSSTLHQGCQPVPRPSSCVG